MDKARQLTRVAIVGAGYAGIAALAELNRQPLASHLAVTLFEKTGHYAAGYAYQTPFHYHLLNGRANAMSAFHREPNHFVAWLQEHRKNDPRLMNDATLGEQFVARTLYQEYMQSILDTVLQHKHFASLELVSAEVSAITPDKKLLVGGRSHVFDRVILALGNPLPPALPFTINSDVNLINNPWDYASVAKISGEDPVLIVGTGLSMVDAVLSLTQHRHTGKIIALSRHGLLPLPHSAAPGCKDIDIDLLPTRLRQLIHYVRQEIRQDQAQGNDWRAMLNGLRHAIPQVWPHISTADKKRFLRHYLPYWNVHRHRVHEDLYNLLLRLQREQRLEVVAGRVLEVAGDKVIYALRGQDTIAAQSIQHVINCTGPSLNRAFSEKTLLNSLIENELAILDDLQLGLCVTHQGQAILPNGKASDWLYVLGSLTQGMSWETVAVPEISQQSEMMAESILESLRSQTVVPREREGVTLDGAHT